VAEAAFAERDRSYYRDRAAAERAAAARASCMIKDVHLELAELYEDMAARGVRSSAPGRAA